MTISVIRQLAGGILIGLTATVFAISFASIIYGGDLGVFLDRGIGLSLLGSAVMAGFAAALFTFRGTVMHPQDVTAILLSGGASTIVASGRVSDPETAFATVAMLVAVSTAIAGLACISLGYLRLSFAARFLPFPVLGGFLAATGYLLLTGGLGLALGESVTIFNLGVLLEPSSLARWLPWALAGLATSWVTSRLSSGLLLPACFLASGLAFFAALFVLGETIEAAMANGWLLGPFPKSGFIGELNLGLMTTVDWGLLASQFPVILGVVAMTVLGALLNITGINHVVGNDGSLDLDLRNVGVSNLAASAAGGMVGYPALGESVLGYRLGLAGAVAGISVVALNLLAAFAGASVLAVLPKGLFAMVLIYIGVDLLLTWLWQERKRLRWADFGIVLAILLTAATVGFLPALAVGILVSMTLFIVSYAGLEFIRLQSTLANRRSMVERAEPERTYLEEAGKSVIVLELTGFLFFGTAATLRSRVLAMIQTGSEKPKAIVMDLRRVTDIDTSASVSLDRTLQELKNLGVWVLLTGLNTRVGERMGIADRSDLDVRETLEDALQVLEDYLLAEAKGSARVEVTSTFLESLKDAHPDLDLEAIFTIEKFSPGASLIKQGALSNEIFVLVEGEANAIIGSDIQKRVVAKFLPGALLGEMAFYGASLRSADVVAVGEVRALRIDAKQIGADSDLPPDLVSSIHRLTARILSQRLERSNRLLMDAEI